jgi:formate dehydrogenase maturation protein FdhE
MARHSQVFGKSESRCPVCDSTDVEQGTDLRQGLQMCHCKSCGHIWSS